METVNAVITQVETEFKQSETHNRFYFVGYELINAEVVFKFAVLDDKDSPESLDCRVHLKNPRLPPMPLKWKPVKEDTTISKKLEDFIPPETPMTTTDQIHLMERHLTGSSSVPGPVDHLEEELMYHNDEEMLMHVMNDDEAGGASGADVEEGASVDSCNEKRQGGENTSFSVLQDTHQRFEVHPEPNSVPSGLASSSRQAGERTSMHSDHNKENSIPVQDDNKGGVGGGSGSDQQVQKETSEKTQVGRKAGSTSKKVQRPLSLVSKGHHQHIANSDHQEPISEHSASSSSLKRKHNAENNGNGNRGTCREREVNGAEGREGVRKSKRLQDKVSKIQIPNLEKGSTAEPSGENNQGQTDNQTSNNNPEKSSDEASTQSTVNRPHTEKSTSGNPAIPTRPRGRPRGTKETKKKKSPATEATKQIKGPAWALQLIEEVRGLGTKLENLGTKIESLDNKLDGYQKEVRAALGAKNGNETLATNSSNVAGVQAQQADADQRGG